MYVLPRVRPLYAFEPDPRSLPGLRANTASAGDIAVVATAVSSCDGDARAVAFLSRS